MQSQLQFNQIIKNLNYKLIKKLKENSSEDKLILAYSL